MESDNNFVSRMRKLAELCGSQNSLAKKAGISQSGIRRYFSGGEPSRAIILALSKAAEVSPAWLLTGEGEMRPNSPSKASVQNQEFEIPAFDILASTGPGAINDKNAPRKFYRLSKDFFKKHFGIKAKQIFAINYIGDSMYKSLGDAGVAIIDKEISHLPGDGIYLIRIDGHLMIKRIQILPGGIVEINSENPNYKTFTVNLKEVDQVDFAVLGRLIAAFKEF